MVEEHDLDRVVEQAVNEYVEWAAGLNITLSEDEIDEKRAELRRSMGGPSTQLASAGVREVESFDEVAELLSYSPEEVLIVDDYQKLDDKSQLVNVPFFINRWWFTEGDMGEFAVMRCVTSRKVLTPAGETDKVVLSDGSTGIYQQLKRITLKTQKTAALMVRHGLRVSQYTADTETGPKAAETFYLT
jgi:hypothetical protein